MAKKAAKKTTAKKTAKSSAKAGGKGGKSQPATKQASSEAENSIDGKAFKIAVEALERLDEELLSEKGRYMERAGRIQKQKDVVLDEAKSKGLPKKELKAVVKARSLERKADAIFEELEADEQDTFTAMRNILGDWADDTPLGKFASDQKAAASKKSQTEKDDLISKIGRGNETASEVPPAGGADDSDKPPKLH